MIYLHRTRELCNIDTLRSYRHPDRQTITAGNGAGAFCSLIGQADSSLFDVNNWYALYITVVSHILLSRLNMLK